MILFDHDLFPGAIHQQDSDADVTWTICNKSNILRKTFSSCACWRNGVDPLCCVAGPPAISSGSICRPASECKQWSYYYEDKYWECTTGLPDDTSRRMAWLHAPGCHALGHRHNNVSPNATVSTHLPQPFPRLLFFTDAGISIISVVGCHDLVQCRCPCLTSWWHLWVNESMRNPAPREFI